jgi:hypothetical protein
VHFQIMMSFTNAINKRRIASVMLVFWLFAPGVGWAHARILKERATHLHPDAAEHTGMQTIPAGHAVVMDAHEADTSAGKAPCLKVYGDESKSIVKWHASFFLDVAMVPPTGMHWPATVAALDAPVRIVPVGQSPRTDPPLRTRYSRLAL